MFRLLPSHEREDVFDLVYFKYKKYVEKKMESIYWTYAEGSGDEKSGPSHGLMPGMEPPDFCAILI